MQAEGSSDRLLNQHNCVRITVSCVLTALPTHLDVKIVIQNRNLWGQGHSLLKAKLLSEGEIWIQDRVCYVSRP